jgi:chromosome segregation ATPase
LICAQNKKLLEEVAELDEEVKKGQRGGGKDSAAARRKEMELRKEISILEDKIDMHKAVEEQLESAKGVITVLEARQAQLDDMLGGLQHERDHIDEVVSEMRKLRIQVRLAIFFAGASVEMQT